ncbi:hypothetical protein BKA60DRAFT_551520 [Fusarium oxysporum]|nr:hypothetical protein BKA60DRAFT_551520 [Fusarium oxysporum]
MNRLCFTFQSLGFVVSMSPVIVSVNYNGCETAIKDKNEGRYPRCLAANATLDLFPRPLSIFSASTLFCQSRPTRKGAWVCFEAGAWNQPVDTIPGSQGSQ